jgi:DNA-binding NarL/FixJ family response regulator
MPSRAEQPARRETLTRQAARRQAVDVLRVAEAVAGYSARQLSNGLGPEAARQAALDAAGELELVAGTLRRLTRLELNAEQRRALAVQLAASGLSQRQIAEQVGRSKRTVWGYLRGRS